METSSPVPGPTSDNVALQNDSTLPSPPSRVDIQTFEAEIAPISTAQLQTELPSQMVETSCWTPSKRAALDPSHLRVPRIPRAWERAPTLPASADSRFGLVWRRFDSKNPRTTTVNSIVSTKSSSRRTAQDGAAFTIPIPDSPSSQTAEDTSGPDFLPVEEAAVTVADADADTARTIVTVADDIKVTDVEHERPVKRLRAGRSPQRDSSVMNGLPEKTALSPNVALAVPTKWQRRTSLLPHKLQSNAESLSEEVMIEDQNINSTTIAAEIEQKTGQPITSTPSKSLSSTPQLVPSPQVSKIQTPKIASNDIFSVPDQSSNTAACTIPPLCENLDMAVDFVQEEQTVDAKMSIVQGVLVQNLDPTNVVVEAFFALEPSTPYDQTYQNIPAESGDKIPVDSATSVELEKEFSAESQLCDNVDLFHATTRVDISEEISKLPSEHLMEAFSEETPESLNDEITLEESAEPILAEESTSSLPVEEHTDFAKVNLADDVMEQLELDDISTDSESESEDDFKFENTENLANLVNIEEPTIHFGSSKRDSTLPSTPPHQLVSIDCNNPSTIPKSLSPLIKLPQLDPPSPVFEEATATITMTALSQLEDDKAFLQSFLDRAAAKKSDRLTNTDGNYCTRQEKLENRRHSDVVRQALASPRPPLEAKDANLFSPRKPIKETDAVPTTAENKEQAEPATLVIPPLEELIPAKSTKKSSPRRSGRARKQSTSQQTSAQKRSTTVKSGEDAIFALQTRQNTRKNKGAALSVIDRLVKLRAELTVFGVLKDGGEMSDSGNNNINSNNNSKSKAKGVKWSEHLWVLDQSTGQTEMAPILDNAQLPKVTTSANSTTVQMPIPPMKSGKVSTRGQTARLRKLGAMNGTPAKDILGSTLLPDEVMDQQDFSSSVSTGSPKRVATGSIIPSGTEKKAKSRLPAPKKLNLNPSVSSVTQSLQSEAELSGSTNSKGGTRKKTPATKKIVSLLPTGAAPKRAARTKS